MMSLDNLGIRIHETWVRIHIHFGFGLAYFLLLLLFHPSPFLVAYRFCLFRTRRLGNRCLFMSALHNCVNKRLVACVCSSYCLTPAQPLEYPMPHSCRNHVIPHPPRLSSPSSQADPKLVANATLRRYTYYTYSDSFLLGRFRIPNQSCRSTSDTCKISRRLNITILGVPLHRTATNIQFPRFRGSFCFRQALG